MTKALYIFVGYPGAGKTTIAKHIHDKTKAVHIWADHKRHQLFKPVTYSEQESEELYSKLNHLAEKYLSNGESVIYDTNFNFYDDRELLREIAKKHDAQLKLIWVTTPVEIARKRAISESRNGHTAAMEPVYFDKIKSHLEAPNEDEQPIKIDGSNLDLNELDQLLKLN